MPDIRVKTETLFQIFLDDAQNAYAEMVNDVDNAILRMKMLGMSSGEIYDRLIDDLKNDTGVFQSFRGNISKSVTDLIGTTSQVESNELIKNSSDLFVWELDPTAKEHCETCVAYATMDAQPWDEWEKLGIPGAGNTKCGQYCKCTLVREGDAEKGLPIPSNVATPMEKKTAPDMTRDIISEAENVVEKSNSRLEELRKIRKERPRLQRDPELERRARKAQADRDRVWAEFKKESKLYWERPYVLSRSKMESLRNELHDLDQQIKIYDFAIEMRRFRHEKELLYTDLMKAIKENNPEKYRRTIELIGAQGLE